MAEKKRILVIDDEEDICSGTKSILEKTGRFEVITSTDSQTGIDLAKNNRPDLVLLDINMPVMDGGEVAQSIRDCRYTSETPIIFITALLKKDELDSRSGGKIGRNYFLAKPITGADLVKKIDSVLLGLE